MVRSRAGGSLRSRSREKEEKEKGKTNGERKHFGGEEGGDSKVGRGAADGRNGMPWYSPFFCFLIFGCGSSCLSGYHVGMVISKRRYVQFVFEACAVWRARIRSTRLSSVIK